MKYTQNLSRLLLVSIIYVILMISNYSNGINAEINPNQEFDLNSAGELVLTPNTNAELTNRIRTKNLIEKSRALSENNATSLDLIFFRLLGLQVLDPLLGNISVEVKNNWIDQVLSFQNLNGGFGHWFKDASSITATYKSLEILKILNYDFGLLDINLINSFIERLFNALTGGYNSNLADGDSDVLSTYYAVKAYSVLGNSTLSTRNVADLFIRAQNLDGGFGQQTNNVKGIYWTSEATTTNKALEALEILGSIANDTNQAESFLDSVQALNGGFVNNILSTIISLSYTSSATHGLASLSSTPYTNDNAYDYFISLESTDGSFHLKESSVKPSLKATYFAILGLDNLNGSTPTDILKTIDYLINFSFQTDGYGGYPGEEPTLRETFDAVAAFDNMGITPTNPNGITDFAASYRNPDGGYGITTVSYVDGTNRVVNIYDILGIAYPNPSSTISFLQGLQLAGGGFAKKKLDSTPLVVSTYRAVLSLSLLGAQPVNPTNAIAYLKSTQNTDGGFGGFIGDISDVTTTYRAIRALLLLGDSTFNSAAAITFIQSSQNLDGGYKRSSYDVLRPKNVSQAVYTYSAARVLLLLNAQPTNVSGLYYYVESLRNTDGGFAEHPDFTSDNAYTFTSMWILSNFDEISQFGISIPDNLNQIRSNYDNFQFRLLGSTMSYNYTISNLNTSQTMVNGLSTDAAVFLIDTATFAIGSYQLNFHVFDFTGASINQIITLLISDVILETTTTTDTISSDTNTIPTEVTPETSDVLDNIIIFAGAAGVLVVVVFVIQTRKGNKK